MTKKLIAEINSFIVQPITFNIQKNTEIQIFIEKEKEACIKSLYVNGKELFNSNKEPDSILIETKKKYDALISKNMKVQI